MQNYDNRNQDIIFQNYQLMNQNNYYHYLQQPTHLETCQREFENCIDSFSDHILNTNINQYWDSQFLSKFPQIFANLFNVHSDPYSLVNTPMSESFYSNKMVHLSHTAYQALSNDTKPVIYIAMAGDIDLLSKIDHLLKEPGYKMRLSNGFNLLHCLIGNQYISIEKIRPTIEFLLDKNIHMLTEVDHLGITPLQYCNTAFYTCLQQYYDVDQTIMQMSSESKNANHKNKFQQNNKIYFSNQIALKNNINDRINILKEISKILQTKLTYLTQAHSPITNESLQPTVQKEVRQKSQKTREALQTVANTHVQSEAQIDKEKHTQEPDFKYRTVSQLSKSSPDYV